MKPWLKVLIVLLVAAVIGAFAYKRFGHPADGAHGGPPGGMGAMGAPPVDVAKAVRREVQIWHDFSGRLTASEIAEVRPRVSGILEEVHFADGSMVEEGDPLFTIDRRRYAAAVEQAQGALASAQAQAELAKGEFGRAEGLYKDKALSKRDYEQRRNNLDVAAANLKAAQAMLELAQLNLDYTIVKAPIGGRIGRAEITQGNLVEAGMSAPVLTTIVSNAPIYADFEMDESSFLQFIHGATDNVGRIPVRLGLSSEAGFPHEGRIGSFDNRLNAGTGTIRVRAVFENADGALLPGLFARIRIGNPAEQGAILITDRAVGTDQNKKYVLVVGKDNIVEYRQIVPGPLVDGLRVVESGLAPGETIIVNGLQRARPGTPVAPQIVAMDGPANALPGTPAGAPPAGAPDEEVAPDKAAPEQPARAQDIPAVELEEGGENPAANGDAAPVEENRGGGEE